MELTLYRKYRPKNFSEVVGQEHIIHSLQGALRFDRVSHAYLFTGPRGTGKTTVARIFSKAVNCENFGKIKKDEPCNQCYICKEFNEGKGLNLIEIDGASNRGIDEIRNLREGVRFKPVYGKYKVYIIDEVHQLTKEAFNALLKTLEEPPEHVIFILASTEPQKIPETIISRTQRFDFKRLNVEQILKKLININEAEGTKVEKEALRLIALSSDGSLRDAESNLAKIISFNFERVNLEDVQEILGFVPFKTIYDFLNLIANNKKGEAINFVNRLYESGVDLDNFLNSLIDYLRRLLIINLNPATLVGFSDLFSQDQIQLISSQARFFSKEQIIRAIKIFIQAKTETKISSIPQLPIELAIVDLMG